MGDLLPAVDHILCLTVWNPMSSVARCFSKHAKSCLFFHGKFFIVESECMMSNCHAFLDLFTCPAPLPHCRPWKNQVAPNIAHRIPLRFVHTPRTRLTNSADFGSIFRHAFHGLRGWAAGLEEKLACWNSPKNLNIIVCALLWICNDLWFVHIFHFCSHLWRKIPQSEPNGGCDARMGTCYFNLQAPIYKMPCRSK